jgi:hypothetical protein
MFLGSLREVIVRLSGSKEGKDNLTKHFDEILKLLFEHADHTYVVTNKIIVLLYCKLQSSFSKTIIIL